MLATQHMTGYSQLHPKVGQVGGSSKSQGRFTYFFTHSSSLFSRGKMLGGSTGLNFVGWDRASKVEYDTWASFAEPTSRLTTWDFDNLQPYFVKSETVNSAFFDSFPGVSKVSYAAARKAFSSNSGSSGPISVRSSSYSD